MTLDNLLAQEFPLRQDVLYLNHAAVAPWPRRTAQAVQQFAEENITVGALNYPRWMEAEAALRRQCAQLINAPANDVAFLKNTSEALSVVAHGFPWKDGDNVVLPDEEFPSNRIVWESLCRFGVQVRTVVVSQSSDPESALIDATDNRTRLIAASSVQYGSGLRMDLAKLGETCRRRNIAFCVDAIQGLGVFAHDVQTMHIDFLMADAHKWLLGPEGIAVFYCHPAWRDRLTLRQYGWHMIEDAGNYDRVDWEIAHDARRFECGSVNMLGIHALSASLSLLLDIGIPEIERRVLLRAERLFQEIRRHPTLDLVTKAESGRYAGIVTFRHRQRAHKDLYAKLRDAAVVCAPRGGGVRFSPHFYTPLEHLGRAVALAAQ